ncbi:MAG: carbamoyltransferase HypF [Vicinamibacterales bacterium]
MTDRKRFIVQGVVQGVGFRPFVSGLAVRLGLGGFVRNSNAGVVIEVEGASGAIDAFARALVTEAPPLAAVETVTDEGIPTAGDTTFRIDLSRAQPGERTSIPPDVATCDACLRELGDPTDRRFRYPFLNCTHCGPRFTIIEDLPYDRAMTTMRAFAMCDACRHEYEDPGDRRFHAEPTACPACGPRLWWERGDVRVDGWQAVEAARDALGAGAIVAVKGIGGFHLACDATSDAAIARLRERKGRVDKPFALMVRTLEAAARIARVSVEEARYLTSRERPIVLVERVTPGHQVSALVAPGQRHLGVMLPYSPLHQLLLADLPLVMTSGNRSDEPIARDNDEARERLGALADAFLLHDRPIHSVCDDSVIRVFAGGPLPVRRSRGYAPFPVHLPFETPPILAVGGELKATFSVAHGHDAYLSQHVGDMENLETLDAFERAVDHLLRLFRIEPVLVAADPHPGYLSTAWARTWAAARGIGVAFVQHHHAHLGAVMAEHRLHPSARAIGLIFDGTGDGLDGTVWGGEILLGGYGEVRRVGALAARHLPASDADLKRCDRLALAHLRAAGVAWDDDLPPVRACAARERAILDRRLAERIGVVSSSSMGRLFDAVSSLLGVRHVATYEGQAAIELEGISEPAEGVAEPETGFCDFGVGEREGRLELDPSPVLRSLVDGLRRGERVGVLAGAFHAAVARAAVDVARRTRAATGVEVVAISGGVFQNVRLLGATVDGLRREGFEVFVHRLVPPNDGGLALGQLACAARMRAEVVSADDRLKGKT